MNDKDSSAICFSHVGQRLNYEDNFFVNGIYLTADSQKQMLDQCGHSVKEPELSRVRLFAISDGMGGHNAGEVASLICVEKLSLAQRELQQYISLDEAVAYLQTVIAEINNTVCEQSQMKKLIDEAIVSHKADNATVMLFVSENGEYKIGDFGVSKVLKDSSKAESLKGTPNFLAPEVYLGKESYTKSVDLYSLGIVLYRLLNYSRNPFLPRFPEQYFSQDEDAAFEERMSGKAPELPLLGGEAIGHVIVKAISNSTERFQTADEFINALEAAIDNTPTDVFNEKISFGAFSFAEHSEKPKAKQYGSTIGETAPQSTSEEQIEDEHNNSLNKHLFESIGEVPSTDVPEMEPIVRSEVNTGRESIGGDTPPRTTGRVVNVVPPDIDEPDEPAALDKKVMNKFVFFVPVVILLVGIAVYFIVVPNIYGKVVSFVDWLFTDPENIINTLRDPNSVLPKVNSIIGMRIFWWVWLASLISSLFFVGKQLQAKPEPNATNAILTKKEPYLMIQDVTDALKQLKTRRSSHQLDSLMYSVKKLEEKLSIESDFGYGKSAVINCENNIARQIQFLLDTVPCVENGDFEENLKAMSTAVMNINSLLRKRIELKKK